MTKNTAFGCGKGCRWGHFIGILIPDSSIQFLLKLLAFSFFGINVDELRETGLADPVVEEGIDHRVVSLPGISINLSCPVWQSWM